MRRTPWYPVACALLALSACSDAAGSRTPLGLLPTDGNSLVIPVLATTAPRTAANIGRALIIDEGEPDPGGGGSPRPPAPPSGGGDLFAGALTLDDSLARLSGIPTDLDPRLRTYFGRIDDNTTAYMLELEAWVRAHKVTLVPSVTITRTTADFNTSTVSFPSLEPWTWNHDIFSVQQLFDTFRGRELHFIHSWRRTLPVPMCGLTSNAVVTATSMWARIPSRDLLPGEWGHQTREASDLKRTDPCNAPCPPTSSPRDGPPEQDASATPMGTVMSASGDCGPPTGGGGGGGGGGGRWIQIEICFGNHVYDSNGNYLYSEILYCITDYIYVE